MKVILIAKRNATFTIVNYTFIHKVAFFPAILPAYPWKFGASIASFCYRSY